MPLKAMGYMDRLEIEDTLKSFKTSGGVNNVLISTSSVMRNAVVASFLIDPCKVFVT